MITEIGFKNFKLLRDTVLRLGRFTLLVGANSTGKSTVLEALRIIADEPKQTKHRSIVSQGSIDKLVEINVVSDELLKPVKIAWTPDGIVSVTELDRLKQGIDFAKVARGISVFTLVASEIGAPAKIREDLALSVDGSGLAATLDRLRDISADRFNALNKDVSQWFPEFDLIGFSVSSERKSIQLRLRGTQSWIDAQHLSEGTLLALALLTLTHLPDPPRLVAIEEPERGLHPRLLQNVQQALLRLAYPEDFGDNRPPVQVLATTHSPYLVDLFKDHPEDVVVAEKVNGWTQFRRLTDTPELQEAVQGSASLGEIWFSGVLGGVPELR